MCKRQFHLILTLYHAYTVLLNLPSHNSVRATEEFGSKNCSKEIIEYMTQETTLSRLTTTKSVCLTGWKWWSPFRCKREKHIYWKQTELVSKSRSIQICCKNWKEWNETVCVKACKEGMFGDECQHNCTCPENEFWQKECDKRDGTCYCEAGYAGMNCTKRCEDGYFGSGCNQTCTCLNNNSCDIRDGTCNCTVPGWKGTFCEEACDPGTYGIGCKRNCTCPANATCNRKDGDCICEAGKRGRNCSDECNDFSFGEDCKYDCTCFKNTTESCDPVSGVCKCKPGWTGLNCDATSYGNTYGPMCALNCSCDLNEFCDPELGNCYREICHSPSTQNCAYELQECPETQQKESFSGEDELPLFFKTLYNLCEQLSSYPNKGICLANESCICSAGRKGEHCIGEETDVTQPQINKKITSGNANKKSVLIIVAISTSVAVVLILILICILVRRYKARKNRRLKAVQNNGYGLVALQMNEDIIPSSNLQNEMAEETYDRLDRNGSDRKQDREVEDSNHAGTEDTYSHATAGPDYDTTRGYLEGRETDNEYAVGGQSKLEDLHSRKDTDFDYDSVQRHKVDDVDESEYSQANLQLKKQGKDHEMSQDETYDRSENFKTRTSGTIDSDINNYSLASQADH